MLTRVSAGMYTLAVLGALILFFSSNPTATFEELGMPADQAGWFTADIGFGALFGSAIALSLYVLVYKGLKRGRNRARVFGIAFASISILGTVAGLFQPLAYGGWEVLHILIRISGIIVDTLWMITALRKPLPRWFARPF
jgi:drug/metabolite transporter (DMT)-like permease